MFEVKEKAIIGVLGGSGNYNPEFFETSKEIKVYTPFGSPSSKVIIGKVGDISVAFIARHGKDHTIPPHKINYRANIWALKGTSMSARSPIRSSNLCLTGSLRNRSVLSFKKPLVPKDKSDSKPSFV